MRLEYDNVSRTTQSPPGVNTKVPGWGHSNTVEHIDPGLSDFGKYFNTISDMLVDFGLVRDISLRAAPYDFRKAPSKCTARITVFSPGIRPPARPPEV